MLKKVYITHCSREKDPEYEKSGKKTTPDNLYTSPALQRFIKFCKENNHYWAICSTKYGFVGAYDLIKWYNRPPDRVTEEDYKVLIRGLVKSLSFFDEVYFLQRPEDTHSLFKRIEKDLRDHSIKVIPLEEKDLIPGT